MSTLLFVNLGSTEIIMTFLIFGWSPVLLILYCLFDILKSRFKNSFTKSCWLLLTLIIPVIGAVVYLVVGRQNKIRAKVEVVSTHVV